MLGVANTLYTIIIFLIQVDVAWTEVEGSKLIRNKLDIVLTSLRMARDMLCIRLVFLSLFCLQRFDVIHNSCISFRLSYILGIWTIAQS
jgi:hypothetical protein